MSASSVGPSCGRAVPSLSARRRIVPTHLPAPLPCFCLCRPRRASRCAAAPSRLAAATAEAPAASASATADAVSSTLESRLQALVGTCPRFSAAADVRLRVRALEKELVAQNKARDAAPLFEDALLGFSRSIGADDPATLWCEVYLADLLSSNPRSEGDLCRADALYTEALERRQSVLGGKHPDTLDTAGKAGVCKALAGDLDAAERLFRSARDGLLRTCGATHLSTLGATSNLARVLAMRRAAAGGGGGGGGLKGEAVSLAREAAAGYEAALGCDAPAAAAAREMLQEIGAV